MVQKSVYLFLSTSVLFHIISRGFAREVFVTYDPSNNRYRIVTEKTTSYVARALFNDTIHQTGITTSDEYKDDAQAYAAGLAEGYLTRDLISDHWINTAEGYCSEPPSPYCKRLHDFLEKNLAWMTEEIKTHTNSSYWHQVRLFLIQLNALTDGYQNTSGQPSTQIKDPLGLLFLQIQDDVYDLENVLHKEDLHHVLGEEKCSALFKLLPDNRDILIAHDTWSSYNTMLRMIKKYEFSFRFTSFSDHILPGKSVVFSSYPGTLFSTDDFYMTSANLVRLLWRPIGNHNATLWDQVRPTNQVFESIRNIVANRLADTIDQWVDVFKQYNSGTYNNEWMIMDYKRFKPGEKLPDKGLFMVLEQLPGIIEYEDMSSYLKENTYWASYNLPFFEKIYNMSGTSALRKKYGDFFSHADAPRARIFRRDHSHVVDLPSMTRLMRYNDFQTDPLSRCECNPPYSADNAISARDDLNQPNGTYHVQSQGYRAGGGLDMKMTSYSMHQDFQMIAISGPTFQEQPPFRWSTSGFNNISHKGHPDLFKFDPVHVQWN